MAGQYISLQIRCHSSGSYPCSVTIAERTAVDVEVSARKACAVLRIMSCSCVNLKSMGVTAVNSSRRSGAVDFLGRYFLCQQARYGVFHFRRLPARTFVHALGGAPAIGDGNLAALG